jgi:hypothetical protein
VADDELAAYLGAIRDSASVEAGSFLYNVERLQRKSPDHLGLLGWDEDETDKGIADLSKILAAAPLLLAAIDAVLTGHPLTATVRYAVPCDAHAYTAIGARRDCPQCVKVEYHDGCQECRDEFGQPVRPEDCRARKAILTALTGKAADGG